MENLMKAHQAAKILAISEATFNKLVNEGKIKYVAVGKRARRYTQEAIKEFREEATKCKQ